MKKATYKGTISQDVKNFDLANINAYDWFSQFPKNVATQKESDLIKKLDSVIKSNDVEKNYTFSDDRFVLIATNLIRGVPKEKYDFTISEYLIFYRYLETKYDKNIQGIDSLIEFVNQMIGFSAEGGSMSDEQKAILSETAESIELEALRMCPVFIAEDIDNAMKEDVEEVDMAGVEVLEKPEEKDLIDEIEEEEEEEAIIDALSDENEVVEEKEEPSEVTEWRDTIATLQELIDENDSPESNAEWQETIETLKELITDSGYMFEYGGVTNRNVFAFRIPTWAAPALINADLSGLNDEEIEKLDEFVDDVSNTYGNAYFMLGDDSDVVEFKRSNDIDGNVGGDVTTLYVEATLPRRMYNDGGMSDSDIRAEIERQEKKLSLASLPESAKDVIRKKIANLEAQLSEDDEDDLMSEEQMRQEMLEQETDAYYKEQAKRDSEIYAEIKRQENKLSLASLPESAKEVIRKKIAALKGQLSTADEEPIKEEARKKVIIPAKKPDEIIVNEPIVKPQPKPKEKPIEKVIDKLEEIEEEDEESPIEKAFGKIKKVEEESKEPKKRGRKPKAKVEPAEPKIPQKRGRKPKPKVEAEPKVPQKRGRKPKPKLSLTDFGIGTKFNINDFI
jgi:hypothetical protein